MPDEDLVRPELVAVRASRRWWVIHFPAVVCTSSPSTTTSLVAGAAYPVSSDGCRTVACPGSVSALIRRCAVNSSVS